MEIERWFKTQMENFALSEDPYKLYFLAYDQNNVLQVFSVLNTDLDRLDITFTEMSSDLPRSPDKVKLKSIH